MAGLGTKKHVADAMSRKSTAMSEHGTPGGVDQPRLGSGNKMRGSSRGSKKSLANSNTERSNLFQDAEDELITLSLDPKASKKKKPRNLKPLVPQFDHKKPAAKIAGNVAAEFL